MVSIPKVELSNKDKIAVAGLVVFLVFMYIVINLPRGDCEVARPGYKCQSIKNVMVENCNYWSGYSCDTSKDISLKQVEWYIGNLCNLQNQYHSSGLDCSNLQRACNQISSQSLCTA